MKFNKLINSLLGEELSDRDKRIQALRSASMLRTFTVEYQEYQRHLSPPLQKFTVQGHTLWEALKQLPVHVFDDVITEWVENLEELEASEEALKEYLDNIDFGGWPFFTVYEDETLLCGIPPEVGGYEDEEEFNNLVNRLFGEQLSDREKRIQTLRSASMPVLKIGGRVQAIDDLQIPLLWGGIDLSNQTGTIVDYDEEDDRWAVRFDRDDPASGPTWLTSDDLIPI